jgi:uncharacterized membrane protein YccC
MIKNKFIQVCISFQLLIFTMPAFAYIDPGTGGMLLQGVLALVASVVFYLRNPSQLWAALCNYLKRKFKL